MCSRSLCTTEALWTDTTKIARHARIQTILKSVFTRVPQPQIYIFIHSLLYFNSRSFFSFDVSDDFAFFGAAIVRYWIEWIVDAVAKSHYRIKYGEMYVMMIKNGRTSGLNRML